MTTPETETTIPTITERWMEKLAKERKIYPARVNRASSLGHPCERRLTYQRTHGEHASLPEVVLQSIFNLGHLYEKFALRTLEDIGYELYEQQVTVELRDHQITGHLDCVIGHKDWGDVRHVCDIKSCSEHVWKSVSDANSLFHHRHAHVRAYPAQLTLYLLLKGETEHQRALILFINKQTGIPKEVWLDLDWDYADSLLKKAQRINEHVSRGTLPDRIPYEPSVCGRCEFRHICVPDLTDAEAIVWLDDPKLADELVVRTVNESASKAFKDADKAVKDAAKARFNRGELKFVVGDWLITGKQKINKAWVTTIEPLTLSVDDIGTG